MGNIDSLLCIAPHTMIFPDFLYIKEFVSRENSTDYERKAKMKDICIGLLKVNNTM